MLNTFRARKSIEKKQMTRNENNNTLNEYLSEVIKQSEQKKIPGLKNPHFRQISPARFSREISVLQSRLSHVKKLPIKNFVLHTATTTFSHRNVQTSLDPFSSKRVYSPRNIESDYNEGQWSRTSRLFKNSRVTTTHSEDNYQQQSVRMASPGKTSSESSSERPIYRHEVEKARKDKRSVKKKLITRIEKLQKIREKAQNYTAE